MANPQSFCAHYNRLECRSCSWIETPYSAQITQKEAQLRALLPFYPNLNLLPTARSSETQFRNKAKMLVTGTTAEPIIGLLGEHKRDEGRELLDCAIHHPKLNELLQALPAYIREFNLIPYQIESRTGELKGLILFYSPFSSELYLRFVLRSKECISRLKKMLPRLQKQFPHLTSVSANLQPIPHAILEGKEEIFITEQTFIRHEIGSFSLKLSPQAFVQTHTLLARELYQTAAQWISEIKPEVLLELYCGQGAFSFFSAEHAKKIVGLEVNPEAVQTANEMARTLGLQHLSFQCVDVTATQTNSQNGIHSQLRSLSPDLILVNPPRRGLGAEGVKLILEQKPAHFIYSSCSAETLSQDLEALAATYDLEKAQIFDLFPHTEHFETLASLRLRK